MKHKKTRPKAQTISFAAGVLLIGMLILGVQSPAQAGMFFDNPDFILLFPGMSQKVSYELPDLFRFDQRIYHTSFILALPADFTSPAPLDFTITTEPSIVSGDAAVVVTGIFDMTPTYNLNYVSGGKFTTKVSKVKYGLGLFFTFATRPYNDPEFPVTVKQTFTFAPPAK
jgi:hypothetical protein